MKKRRESLHKLFKCDGHTEPAGATVLVYLYAPAADRERETSSSSLQGPSASALYYYFPPPAPTLSLNPLSNDTSSKMRKQRLPFFFSFFLFHIGRKKK